MRPHPGRLGGLQPSASGASATVAAGSSGSDVVRGARGAEAAGGAYADVAGQNVPSPSIWLAALLTGVGGGQVTLSSPTSL
jgi:hypothetical protein